jgi:hypothetical protein
MGDPRDDATDAGGVPFAHGARFVSIDPAERRFRVYELRLQATLWRGVALGRAWGRLGAPGRARATEDSDRAAAHAALERAVRRRLDAGVPPRGGAVNAVGARPVSGARVRGGGARSARSARRARAAAARAAGGGRRPPAAKAASTGQPNSQAGGGLGFTPRRRRRARAAAQRAAGRR